MLDSDDAVLLLTETAACLKCEVNLPESWSRNENGAIASAVGPDDQRRFPRYLLRGCAALESRSTLPALDRPQTWYKVFIKNVSRGGLSFYHGEQLFPAERMRILLPDGTECTFEVTRCVRIQTHCFEIGGRYVEA